MSPSTPRSHRPTLEQVAALAGVSRGTASRVLSGASNVSDAAVAAVRKAAAELNYRPNLAARSLVTGRSDLVGLLVDEPQDKIWNDPFFGEIARGAHDRLTEAGVALVLSLSTAECEREQLLELAQTRLDGLLVVRGADDADLLSALAAAGITCVATGRPLDGLEQRFGWVDSDNRAGAREVVAHLIARGARSVGVITGPRAMSVSQDRLDGWRDALADAGLTADDSLIEVGGFTIESGAFAIKELLSRHPDLDAVFAQNDLMALGVMRQLRVEGISVPERIRVAGFDDLMAAESVPALTSVAQDVRGIGAAMADQLLARLGGATPASTVLPTRLVVRDST